MWLLSIVSYNFIWLVPRGMLLEARGTCIYLTCYPQRDAYHWSLGQILIKTNKMDSISFTYTCISIYEVLNI